MKTKQFKTLLVYTLIALFITPAFSAQRGDFSKPIKEEHQISKGALLELDCEFTNIKAHNWDKDVISIEINITVDAKNKEKAQDKFKRVKVEIQASSDRVYLSTRLAENYFGNGKNNNIEIEAIIYYPEHIRLSVDNEFGSSFFEDIAGKVDVDIAYGNFRANNLTSSELDLEVEFGKIEVNRFQAGDVDVAYGGFTAQIVGDLHLESEFSSNEMESVEHIRLSSAYDKVYIGQLGGAIMDNEFTGLRIDQLNKSLKLETSYGSLKVNNIAEDFKKININSEFTGVKLYFSDNPSFAFKVSAEMGDFNYPKDLAHITMVEKEMFELSMEGYFGEAKGADPKLLLDLSNATATIKVND